MAQIFRPGQVTFEELPVDQKLVALMAIVMESNRQVTALAQTFYNSFPCKECGFRPESQIMCSTCTQKLMEKQAEEEKKADQINEVIEGIKENGQPPS